MALPRRCFAGIAGLVAFCASATPLAAFCSTSPAVPIASSPSPAVEIRLEDGGYRLYRGGQPYYVNGVGGSRFLESAAAAGANSVRTWGAGNARSVLDRAARCGMSVALGIWLSHDPEDYLSDTYRAEKTAQVQDLLDRYRHHPALLLWSLGNEINLEGAATEAAWRFVNRLTRRIQSQDPDHPVISVIAHSARTLENIARNAPDLDAVGINAYGSLPQVRALVDASPYRGPYFVTEWGVEGHWEAARTAWGRPIEPTSAAKAAWMSRCYAAEILAQRDRCLGSYVFLWGQKQERTPTWYSMLLPGVGPTAATPAVGPRADVMTYHWSGAWPANRAPAVTSLTLDGATAQDDVTLVPGQGATARVKAHDPEDDRLTYLWEVLAEPTVLGAGGSWEPWPAVVARFWQRAQPVLRLVAPPTPGAYRLFVYVHDDHGHAGTANLPFLVD